MATFMHIMKSPQRQKVRSPWYKVGSTEQTLIVYSLRLGRFSNVQSDYG